MIPTSETVTAEWFSEQLNRAGINVQVDGFAAKQIGTGQIGKCVRYDLTYAGSEAGPHSLVMKYPSDDPTSRATGVMLRNFLKEVRFYQEIDPQLSIRTPRCYFAEIVDEGPEFAVLMEDLRPAVQGDQLQGCTPRVAETAVKELIGLHAPSWCDDTLHEKLWLRDAEAVSKDAMREMYQAQLPGFLDRYGESLADDEKGIIAAVAEAESAPLFAQFPEKFSLVHVDYRLDNLLIAPDGEEVTVVDWQSITLGAPLNDVAYFMGAGLVPDDRRPVEESIVRTYHDGLVKAGINDLTWDECWESYRRGVFSGFGVTVVASMLVQRTDRGDEMFTTMARRHARHALDLGSQEFLI